MQIAAKVLGFVHCETLCCHAAYALVKAVETAVLFMGRYCVAVCIQH